METTKNQAEKRPDSSLPMECGPPGVSDVALYDAFQTQVQTERADVSALIQSAAPDGDTRAAQLSSLNTLKSWLDTFRPLPTSVIEELRHFYTVSLTYHSNAIEGNTLW